MDGFVESSAINIKSGRICFDDLTDESDSHTFPVESGVYPIYVKYDRTGKIIQILLDFEEDYYYEEDERVLDDGA